MIIVDTSVAYKWFSKEEDLRAQSIQILQDHFDKKVPILVPDLFYYEISNAWATKVKLPLEHIHEYLGRLHSYQIQIAQITYPFLNNIVKFSKKYKVSVYDATYAVLAEERDCDLITADEKFVRQVDLKYVKLLR